MSSRAGRWAVLVTVCAAVGACAKKEGAAVDTMGAATETAKAAAAAPATPATSQLTDVNIVAILDQANAADSAAGAIAAKKGTSEQVRSFGRRMMADHHKLRVQGMDLSKKLNLTPQLPAGDQSEGNAKAWQDSLNAMPKGKDWDKVYIDHEVPYHEALLQTATSAQSMAQSPELKDFITAAGPAVSGHLELARGIQAKLSGTGASMAKPESAAAKKP
jgi:putative membrane protein